MRLDSRLQSILLALLGVLSIVIYFWLFAHSRNIELVKLQVPKEEILAKAEQVFKQSALGENDLPQSVRLRINEELFRYVQVSGDEQANAKLPLGQWTISWTDKVEQEEDGVTVKVEDGEKKKITRRFAVRYDLKGNLLGLEQSAPTGQTLFNLAEPEAFRQAKNFLASLNVDTAAIKVEKRAISQEGERTKHTFSFTRSSPVAMNWDENFDLEMIGTTVTRYSADFKLAKEKTKRSKTEEVGDIVASVLTPVAWVVISIFLLVIFFRRVRHDELEFKRAAWVGIITGAAMWLMVGIESWPQWAGVLIGGGFAGLFTGAGLLLVYAATESLQREVWKEKLAVVDLLFRGYVRVKEMGQAILRAFFIAGVTLLLVGVTIWLASRFNIGYLKIDNDDLWFLQGQTHLVAALSVILMGTGYIGLMFLAFWPTYLRFKIRRQTILILVTGVFFGLSGLHLNFLRPSYLAIVFFLPIAMLWAWFAYRHDLFTILLSLLAVHYFLGFSLVTLMPEGFFSAVSVTTGVLALGIFLAGVYFIYTKKSVAEFENYVPAYVSRIAERERFLKELEIARSIQMRFLPATPPAFSKLDIACLCRPAMEVGGDYYDFVRHDDQRLSVVIGDVSGKGVSAAFFMTMAKGIIKALSRLNASPKYLLSEMNTVFYENTPKEVFISLIYGLFDLQKNTLTFARAGHNPLIVRKSVGNTPELLNPRGLAIGLERGTVFAATIEEKTVPIQPGDVFVFYTDGISESMNKNGEEFGEERLGQLINQHAQESAVTLLDSITREITTFAGGANQHDDFTMVVVRVK
jgi:hypothetical protein